MLRLLVHGIFLCTSYIAHLNYTYAANIERLIRVLEEEKPFHLSSYYAPLGTIINNDEIFSLNPEKEVKIEPLFEEVINCRASRLIKEQRERRATVEQSKEYIKDTQIALYQGKKYIKEYDAVKLLQESICKMVFTKNTRIFYAFSDKAELGTDEGKHLTAQWNDLFKQCDEMNKSLINYQCSHENYIDLHSLHVFIGSLYKNYDECVSLRKLIKKGCWKGH